MPDIRVHQVSTEKADAVGELVFGLLRELVPGKYDDRVASEFGQIAHRLLSAGRIWVFLALDPNDRPVGVLTLHECYAIYANGLFGEISELYVEPEWRSHRVGALLIDAAQGFGRERGWSQIEVGAPHLPDRQRTVDFYERYGFEVVGPRLHMNLLVL